MNDNYLKHYGKKGMRWGVRRASAETHGPQQKKTMSKDDYKNIKKSVDDSATIVESGRKINNTISKKRNDKSIKEDVTKMTDKDLQQAVNRLNMEERYTQVMSSRATTTGKDRAGKILDNAGTALAIGSSALSIMIAIKELKK
jgi:hypothetical protein